MFTPIIREAFKAEPFLAQLTVSNIIRTGTDIIPTDTNTCIADSSVTSVTFYCWNALVAAFMLTKFALADDTTKVIPLPAITE